jgi:adenylate cyclase class IV
LKKRGGLALAKKQGFRKEFLVEVRGPLEDDEFSRLSKELKARGSFVGDFDRFLVDCSGCRDSSDEFDLRVRVTNGEPELVISVCHEKSKPQNPHTARREIAVKLQPKQMDELIHFLTLVGYERGYLCERRIAAFAFKGVDFLLVSVPGHSKFFEARKLALNDKEIPAARRGIEVVLEELGLRKFSEKDYYSYVEELRRNVDGFFNFKDYKPGALEKYLSEAVRFKKIGSRADRLSG